MKMRLVDMRRRGTPNMDDLNCAQVLVWMVVFVGLGLVIKYAALPFLLGQ